MKWDPMKILVAENIESFSVKTDRNIPYGWREDVKQQLDEIVKKNIIRPLGDEPTEWCSPMVAPKGIGIHICVDYIKLNKYVKRANYPMTTPKQAVSNITSGAKFFSTYDVSQVYWQLELEKKSQILTTFMTPYSCYVFLRAPMGLNCTGDEYCRRGDKVFEEINNLQKVVDNSILYDDDIEQHLHNMRKFLECCRKNNVTLTPKKTRISQESVKFTGYKVLSKGYQREWKSILTR